MLRDIWVKLGWEPAARTNRQTEQKNRAHTFALKTPHVIPACKKKSFQNLHRAPPIPTAPIAALLFSDEKPTGEKPPRQSRVQLKVRSFNHLAAGCLPFFICSCLHTRLPCLPTPPRVTPPLDHAAAGALWMNARTPADVDEYPLMGCGIVRWAAERWPPYQQGQSACKTCWPWNCHKFWKLSPGVYPGLIFSVRRCYFFPICALEQQICKPSYRITRFYQVHASWACTCNFHRSGGQCR